MLSDLKQYIIKNDESIDEYGDFIRLILERTKNNQLLDYFIDVSRQNVWECRNRRSEITLGYTYDFYLYEDIFHDLDTKYSSSGTDYGCVSVVLLMILFCFLEKEDIKIYLLCDSSDYYCEELDSISKNAKNEFTDVITEWVKKMRKYFGICDTSSFISLYRDIDSETGEIDELSNTCESFGSFLSIKLINKKKRNNFHKVMKTLEFERFDTDTFYVADVDNYGDFVDSLDISMDKVTDLLVNIKSVRSTESFQDIFVSYSDDKENPYITAFINDVMKIHKSSKEVIL